MTHTSFEDCEALEQFSGTSLKKNLQHLLAASEMIKALEDIASRGILPQTDEIKIRLLVVRACNTFEIPTIAERPTEVLEFRR